ncbi:MAG: SpoIIE family protein phosphatase [Betaproteobacteria bacterium]|nr:SpoIIE family protein phosphatase [Betaproteobacteria bacterium]
MEEAPSVSPAHTSQDVLEMLSRHPHLAGLPVVENGRPAGLINRNLFMDEMAKPFRRDLFARKSCIAFMDKTPLIVPGSLGIQELSFLALEQGGKTLKDGFIVTDDEGIYRGIGTGESLMRAVSHLQAEKNQQVMESINYAGIIQKSFLKASREALHETLRDHFLLWEPRDRVGGDCYLCRPFDDGVFMALMDCTGHGVPGAFMTLIMTAFLDHVLTESIRRDPAQVLSLVNRKVKSALGQQGGSRLRHLDASEQSDDGMDAALLWMGKGSGQLVYAGARIPLLLLGPGDAAPIMLEGDRLGVGYMDTPMDSVWTNRQVAVEAGTAIYLATDGLTDQIGGPRQIAFGKKRFTALLQAHRESSMMIQQDRLKEALESYQGGQKRRDDLSVLGFRV